jgi:hypothetical protein
MFASFYFHRKGIKKQLTCTNAKLNYPAKRTTYTTLDRLQMYRDLPSIKKRTILGQRPNLINGGTNFHHFDDPSDVQNFWQCVKHHTHPLKISRNPFRMRTQIFGSLWTPRISIDQRFLCREIPPALPVRAILARTSLEPDQLERTRRVQERPVPRRLAQVLLDLARMEPALPVLAKLGMKHPVQ